MTKLTEHFHAGSALLGEEEEFFYCRDTITVGASQSLYANTVLGKVTASGQFLALDPAGADGTESADGVLIYPVSTGAGQTAKAAAWVRGPCTLRGSDLVWPTGITAPQKATAIAALLVLGIKVTAD
jgi:hypothetical protein